MPNRTIYVPPADISTWDEAQRMMPFYQNKSLSAFMVEKAREYVEEENARQAQQARGYDLDHPKGFRTFYNEEAAKAYSRKVMNRSEGKKP